MTTDTTDEAVAQAEALMANADWTMRFIVGLEEVGQSDMTFTFDHSHRKSENPRMSGLGNCGRKQFYDITGAPETDAADPTSNWAQLLGSAAQAIVTAVFEKMGYTVFDVEATVVLENGLITGHIDLKLTGAELGDRVVIVDVKGRSVWGYVGTKNSAGLGIHSFPSADPTIYLQLQSYIKAEGLDEAWVVALPFDWGGTKTQFYQNKLTPQLVTRHVLKTDEVAQDLAVQRGKTVAAAAAMTKQGQRLLVAREFDPIKDNFPCGYCAFRALCISEGAGFDIALPKIPELWKVWN